MAIIHRNAQPFFWEGKEHRDVMCLLIHGFTGSPSEMRVLGQYLNNRGYGVSCPRLPGHGTTPEDMAGTTWQDWYGAVEGEYRQLKKEYPIVIPIGLSMGALLCLHLASRHSVPGLVLLSTAIFIGNRKAYLAPILQYFYSYRDKPLAPEQMEKILADGHFAYSTTPVKALVSLLNLISSVKKEIPRQKAPALIIQSTRDMTVNPKSAQYLYDHLGSREKKLIWLDKSGHLVTLGQEREQVFHAVEQFIAALSAGVKEGTRLEY